MSDPQSPNNDTKQNDAEKKPWTKPVITAVRSGLLSKFGRSRQAAWMDNIDDVPVDDLLKQHGSPLFVVSEKKLRHNAQRIKRAFSGRYPNVVFGWSYKTNYLGAICNVFHQEEAFAEVVSAFEYEKARSLGVPGHCILFNGPFKNKQILELAISEGAHIHIDHLDELYELDQIASEKNIKVPVTIRLNFDTGYTEPWSRFGFNVESGQALDAAWRIARSEFLELMGLHSHIGTFVTETKAYTNQVRIMCEFMNEVEKRTGCAIEYIDIGGGFASLNSLQGTYLPPEQVVPSIEQYAEAICEVLLECTHEREARGCSRPTLVLETGRALVDDAEVLITTVVANKRLPDGKRAVIVDGGVNILFTAFWYNHTVTPTRPLPGKPEETVIYGPLCMNIDVMRYSVMFPPLNINDNLIFSPVGAYNNTQWLQFIEYRPNVVMIHSDKTVSVIRSAETLETITAHECVPEHLKNPYIKGIPANIIKKSLNKA